MQIKTAAQHQLAIARANALMQADAGTAEAEELLELGLTKPMQI